MSSSGSVLTDPGLFNEPFCYFGSVLGLYFFKRSVFIENNVFNAYIPVTPSPFNLYSTVGTGLF